MFELNRCTALGRVVTCYCDASNVWLTVDASLAPFEPGMPVNGAEVAS